MNKLKMGAKAGVTLVELLVVILIITILSVSLLPLLKPYIEQSKYAAEVQPTLGNIQTKINLYQYEKDKLPCTKDSVVGGVKTETISTYDTTDYTWMEDEAKSNERLRAYKAATRNGATAAEPDTSGAHLSNFVDVDWQDLMGKRINPSQFRYHLIKGLGAAKYGYAVGVFGDGNGLARGTGYAILVLVDTGNKAKVIATWERYKPKSDEDVIFVASDLAGEAADRACVIPSATKFQNMSSSTTWASALQMLKGYGWSFNFDDYTTTLGGGESGGGNGGGDGGGE